MKPLNKIDIVLSIFNQENLIERVLYGIFKSTTTKFNLILIFDGCTDRTESRALKYIKKYKTNLLDELIIDHAPNVFETRANNIGFKKTKEDYIITLQDDMVIDEIGWERRLTYPIRKLDNVFAVTSRIAQDIGPMNDLNSHDYFINQSAREFNNLSRDTFAVRDSINRGPVAFYREHLVKLNYLDESFAPSDLDDADISLRAWEKFGLICGAYWINYISRNDWGKSRASDSSMYKSSHIPRNAGILLNNHRDYILNSTKHSKDISLPESEIDYVHKNKTNFFNFLLKYPFRINLSKPVKKFFKKIKNKIVKTVKK